MMEPRNELKYRKNNLKDFEDIFLKSGEISPDGGDQQAVRLYGGLVSEILP